MCTAKDDPVQGARTAIKVVVAKPTGQSVVTIAAINHIIAGTAVQRIITTICSDDSVGVIKPHIRHRQRVVARIIVDGNA